MKHHSVALVSVLVSTFMYLIFWSPLGQVRIVFYPHDSFKRSPFIQASMLNVFINY